MNLEFVYLTFLLPKGWSCAGGGGEKKRILQIEVEKATEEIRDKKASGDDDVLGDYYFCLEKMV